MHKLLITLLASIALPTAVNAETIYRNQYYEPYGSPSYSGGSQNYNDATEQYGSPLGGPTLRGDDGSYYQSDSYGICKKANW